MRFASYACPETLAEALELMAAPDALPVAGGTDLLVKARSRDVYGKRALVDVSRVPELLGVEKREDGTLSIGAAETLFALAESDALREAAPVLWQAVRHVGGVQTRNRATLGGNLVNACPAADGVTACTACGASVVVATADGSGAAAERTIGVGELVKPCPACLAHAGMLVRTCLFADPAAKKTALAAGELVTRVLVPHRMPNELGIYARLAPNEGVGLADAAVAARVRLDDAGRLMWARVCVGGVFGHPEALDEEALGLAGAPLDEGALARAAAALGALMDKNCGRLADLEYKRLAVPALLSDALRALVDDGCGRDVAGAPGLREIVDWS